VFCPPLLWAANLLSVGAAYRLRESGLANNAEAMFTNVEGDWDEVMVEAGRWWRAS
jgi:hypothetical protein